MDAALIERHWGKAREGVPGATWHPLAYHALDVAACLDQMLDGDAARMAPVVALQAGPREAVRAGLVVAAALHDLGKHAPAFQAKAPHVVPGKARAGFPRVDHGHDRTGAATWAAHGAAWLAAHADAPPGAVRRLSRWIEAACRHHGRGHEDDLVPRYWLEDEVRYAAEDLEAAGAFVAAVLALPEARGWQGLAEPTDDRTDETLVAGLVTQADWLGSNTTWFGYEAAARSVADYWPVARQRAYEATWAAGLWVAPRAAPLTLAEALRAESPVRPTPLQGWAAAVPLPDGPCLAVIEDLTGAGKTEAAAVLASRMVAGAKASGVYWAMPTLATANAMYARAAPLAQMIYGEGASAVQMGSKRDLNEAFRAARAAALDEEAGRAVSGADTPAAEIVCSDWLARDGRLGFLAPVGAGTVDQALLGILQARHHPVRLAGLAPRVLIVDEAHAYDAYTGELLRALLRAHAKAGGSAIVLSATLTTGLRARLIGAWQAGRGARPVVPEAKPLPCATLVSGEGGASESFEDEDGRGARRDVPVSWLRAPDEAVRVLAEAARAGAACLWVRNTVDDAREGLALLAEAGVAATLFHSRLTAGDRGRAERALLARFGPGGGLRGGVVVATQVTEQSLDLDFDAMVSDLAPYDALIQRAGRLHRHERTRPAGYERPSMHVLGPAATPDAGAGWYEDVFRGAAYVYPAHGRLWRTARRIEMDGGLALASARPRDLLDWVYAEEDGTPEALAARDLAYEQGEAKGQAQQARAAALRLADGYVGAGLPEERALTRLGQETQPVLLARVRDGRLSPWEEDETGWRAWALSEVSVPARRAGEGVVPEGLADAVAALTAKRPWLTVWVLDEAGEGRVRRGDGVVAVRYGADCGLALPA